MVVNQRVQRNKSFDEKIRELDEEAVFHHADDQAIEIFANSVLHKFGFLPFHELALGVIGAALGLAGFFADSVKFVELDWAFLLANEFAVAAL